MYPLLFKIGPIEIHTYGFMIALGFFAALSTVRRLAARSGMDPELSADTAFWLLVMGLIGARLLFVITRWQDFAADPLAVFRIWEGGLVFFGGPLLALPWGYWWVRRHKMSFWKSIDMYLPALALGHAFGRLGCVAAGCCYGRPTDLPWGLRSQSELVEPLLRGVPLHPVQLYEFTALMVLFSGLLWVHRNRRFDGQVGVTYLLAYPFIRSITETFRGDVARGFVFGGLISTSQLISIIFFATGVLLLWSRLRDRSGMSKGAAR
jgi:phosphatidylglycerol:prolipoprotein diacylglycerol transferase